MSKKELERISIMAEIEDRKLTQTKAADKLKISDRQVRRLWSSYKNHGAAGLVSKKRGQKSNRKIKKSISDTAVRLIREKYVDFGPTLAKEKLEEIHEIKLSVETVRQLMIQNEIWIPKKAKKARIHQRRERRGKEGELAQVDGSPHAWFEDRGEKATLLVAIDDATSKLMALRFEPVETTEGYFELMKDYIKSHGCPEAIYSDRHSIFRVNRKELTEGDGMTQFGRALKELGIKLICANSPQAKGRVERVNGVLQDRLVKELRMRGINTIEEANGYLKEYIGKHNKKFAVEPRYKENAHRKTGSEISLDEILTNHEVRVVSKNLTFQYNNVIYQIQTKKQSWELRKARVQVIGTKDRGIKVKYQNRELCFTTYCEQEKQGVIANEKDLDFKMRRRWKPGKNHPWKR